MGKLWLIAFALSACTTEDDGPASITFPFDGSIEAAWGQARVNPDGGVPTTFPVTAFGIADGAEVQLIAGRSSTAGYPLTTGDDVIIVEQHVLTTSTIVDGHAEFPPLEVVTDSWTAGGDTVPAELLCGATVIAARAYDGRSMLAATWLVAVATCD